MRSEKKRKSRLLAMLGALAFSWVALGDETPAEAAKEANRPNIVLITADDLGMQLGCYGDKIIKTPNMDRLYSEGVRFTNAFCTAASCSPSRSSILTGLYPHENGQLGLSHMGFSMHKAYTNIPAELKKVGYYTGVIGKIHVNPEDGFGFDYHSNYTKWKFNTKEVKKVREEANEFLAKAKDKPFFLYLNFFDPHAAMVDQIEGIPGDPLKTDAMPEEATNPESYNNEGYFSAPVRFGKQFTTSYYNQVKRLDIGMGMVCEQLQKAGKFDNTLIIFISDHGLSGKTTCNESALKIPFLVRWPGNTLKKYSNSCMVSTIDILPTIFAAAGVDASGYKGQGKSFLPLLKGDEVEWPKYAFGEMSFHTPVQLHLSRTVRSRNFRLIRNYYISYMEEKGKKVPEYQLYDYSRNPTSGANVINNPKYAEVRKELEGVLQKWQEDTDDPILQEGGIQELIDRYEKAYAAKKSKAKK